MRQKNYFQLQWIIFKERPIPLAEQVYVNGRYLRRYKASQHIEDRGNQFGDAVYEVIQIYKKRLIDEQGHLDRLSFSLSEIGIEFYMSFPVLKLLIRDLLRRNQITSGQIYIQISRGVATRNHPIPKPQPKAGIYIVTRHIDFDNLPAMKTGIKVMTAPDTRWARPDIKTVGLLPNILAKSDAIENGYDDIVFTDENGILREGSSSNFFAIKGDTLYRYPTNGRILAGITRGTVSSLAPQAGLKIIDDGFPADKLSDIDEAFVTSAGVFVAPVIYINKTQIADGKAGIYTQKLQRLYHDYMMSFAEESL